MPNNPFRRPEPRAHAYTDNTLRTPRLPGTKGYAHEDQLQPRPNSTPPPTNNNNWGQGTLNNVQGTQNNNNKTDVFEGDNYHGTISGGNVGGRNNSNSIHNGAGSQWTAPAPEPVSVGSAELARVRPPVYRGDYTIYGMEMGLYELEKQIEETMNTLGWDEQRKLQRRIEIAKRLQQELQVELQLR